MDYEVTDQDMEQGQLEDLKREVIAAQKQQIVSQKQASGVVQQLQQQQNNGSSDNGWSRSSENGN